MKRMIIVLVLLFSINALLANVTQSARVGTLGGYAPMVEDDISSLILFPQAINNFNVLYVSGVGNGGNTNYLLTHGAPGEKWGMAGGEMFEDDFFSFIHQLDENRAYSVQFTLNTRSNTEEGANDYSYTYSRNEFAFDTIYGWNNGDSEYAFFGGFSYGPNYIGNPVWMDVNSYDDNGDEGSASRIDFFAGFRLRRPAERAIFGIPFSGEFGEVELGFNSSSSEFTYDGSDDPSIDESSSGFSLGAQGGIYHERPVANNAVVYYGVGSHFDFYNDGSKDDVNDSESSNSDFYLAVPNCWIGLEAALKYATVRFGFSRGIDLVVFESYDYGNDDTGSTFGIGQYGWYSFDTGMGVQYGNLHVDFFLNENFYITGPQKIFNDNFGALGASADVWYELGNGK